MGGGITGIVGRAFACLTSRKPRLVHNQVGTACSMANKPACPAGFLVDDGSSSEGRISPSVNPSRAGGADQAVTAETVSTLCHEGRLPDAVDALEALMQADCTTSKTLVNTVLKRCLVEKNLALGSRVHAFVVRMGYQSDTFLCNHILRMYASHGRLQDAMDVFQVVAKPDAFTWSAIISAHVKHGQDKQAIELYHRMRRSSVKPDGHVFVAALQACARGSDLKSGQQDIHSRAWGRKPFVSTMRWKKRASLCRTP